MNKTRNLFLVLATVAASQAHAAIDVAAITAISADVAIVGAAVFAVLVAIKATKLIRRAL